MGIIAQISRSNNTSSTNLATLEFITRVSLFMRRFDAKGGGNVMIVLAGSLIGKNIAVIFYEA